MAARQEDVTHAWPVGVSSAPPASRTTQAALVQPHASSRLDSLDAARATFVLLGLVFHASLPYHNGGYWVVQDASRSSILTVLATVLHSFRMPGFFLIAGILSELVLRKVAGSTFLQRRLARLGIPLVLTLLTCNVLENALLQSAAQNACAPGSQACAVSDAPGLQTGHLWFLQVLIVCTILLVAARGFIGTRWDRLADRAAGLRLPCWSVPIAIVAGLALAHTAWTVASLLAQRVPGVDGSWMGFSAGSTLYGLFFFLLGVAAARSPGALRTVQEPPGTASLASLAVVGAAMLALSVAASPGIGIVARLWVLFTESAATLCLVLVGIHVSSLLFRRLGPHMRFVAEHAYGVYLVHHCVTIAVVLALVNAPVPAELKFLVVLAGTTALSFAVTILGKELWRRLAPSPSPSTAGPASAR